MGLSDKERSTVVELEMEKAHRFLTQAENMYRQELWDLAANRYYYACFHIVMALFVQNGLSAKTHSGLLGKFSQHFVQTGQIDRIHSAVLARLMQLRQKADYNCALDISQADVDQIASSARALVEAVERVMRQNQQGQTIV